MVSMISLYQTFYKEYSAKYGIKTCILLMVGKFYELYDFVDANGETTTSIRSAVERMNIALKEESNKGPSGETLLKAGIPEQTLHKFSQVLSQEGWTIVVVDQIKDASDNVIDRKVSRIISPGTHVEIGGRGRTTVAGMYYECSEGNKGTYGISVFDISTGDIFSLETKSICEIVHMVQVYNVKEIVYKGPDDPSVRALPATVHLSKPLEPAFSSPLFREEFFQSMFRKSLLPICQALSLPFPRRPVLEKGLCTLLQFVQEHFPASVASTQAQGQVQILRHLLHTPSTYLQVNNNVLEQVNYINKDGQSILTLLEKTRSAIGSRALRERMLRPITDEAQLEQRWSDIEWATRMRTDPETNTKITIDRDLKGLYDLPRIHTRISAGTPAAADILQLFQSYTHVECLLDSLEETPLACPSALAAKIRDFRQLFTNTFDERKAMARDAGESLGFLTKEAGPETALLEKKEMEITSSWLTTWNTFCKLVCVSSDDCTFQKKGDGDIQFECPRSIAKMVVPSAASTVCPIKGLSCEVKKSGPLIVSCPQLSACIAKLHDVHRSIEISLRKELYTSCDLLWSSLETIQQDWMEWLGYVDCTVTLAAVAIEHAWVRPTISTRLDIKGLRHPLIETARTRIAYVKHDVVLGQESGAKGWLLYGVNASGKSSLMKAVGIAVLLAQAGSFVPADSMTLQPYRSVYSRIWSHDNLWAGLSSFAVEVGELRDILEGASDRSLVLGDEVCSGTESVSATSLVATTLEHLDAKGSHFIFATHLHDLLKVDGFLPRPGISVFHLRVIRTLEGKLIYDRTLQPGSGSSTYGLEVARAMGLPYAFMERACEIRKMIGGEGLQMQQSAWNSDIFKKSCELCHSAIARNLDVHHIQHRVNGGDNSPRNLIVVCNSCHDKHHAGELEIPPLQQTSEGPERISLASKGGDTKSQSQSNRTVEEMEAIQSALHVYKGRPPERISAALQLDGVSITIAELKRFIRKT
jgi:DNA mismatch repair protein MutS